MTGIFLGDAIGHMPGNAFEDADATGAYTQSPMRGVETWVEIPPERRPPSWKKFNRPVAILKLALEGHPKAGACWEAHCTEKILLCGFEKVHG